MSIVLPSWLPQTLLIKIGIYAAIGLALLVAWRSREARIAEEAYVKGITAGEVRMEAKYKPIWEEALGQAKLDREMAQADRQEAAKQTAQIAGQLSTVLSSLRKLTSVTLTLDERQKNYVEAHTVPPDKLDAALLEITRQIRELEASQPEPVP